jgi:hypothetical protein
MPPPEAVRIAEAARESRIAAGFAAPLAAPDPKYATLWKLGTEAIDATVPLNLQKARKDELGRVGLVMSQWPALAETLAPQLLVERAADRPGAPILTAQGPTIDPRHAAIYYLPGYARIGDRMLIQMIYFVWFAGANGKGLDGLIWRVTIDEHGVPLMYDSIRANGFDHLWFPQAGTVARTEAGTAAIQVPQVVPAGAAFAVRLGACTHTIRRLVGVDTLKSVRTRRLELRPYEDLMTLAAPGGGTRSLFGADGIVAGTRPPGYAVFEAAGIHAAGALRRWGDHRNSPLAATYFDDPRLLGQSFDIEAAPPQQGRSDLLPESRGSN